MCTLSLRPCSLQAPGPFWQRGAHDVFIARQMRCCRESLIFDTGTIKLADFGLSKSLPVNKHAGYDLDSKFKLTGETGSYRYMAPEVFRHEPYNFKVSMCFSPFQASPWQHSVALWNAPAHLSQHFQEELSR